MGNSDEGYLATNFASAPRLAEGYEADALREDAQARARGDAP